MSKKEDQIWEKVFIQQGYGDKERYPGIKAYVIKLYQETMIVFLLSLFYTNKKENQTFYAFLSHFYFHRESNHKLYDYLKKRIDEVLRLQQEYQRKFSLSNIEILGDFHGYKHTKVLLVFENGEKKVATYDNSADGYVNALFLKSMQGYPAILQHTSVHGITLREYIEYKNNFLSWKELAAFYYNFGLQTALFLALRITDLHYENVLISNNYPVFFDLECSFAPDITEVEYSLYLSGIVDSPLLTESFWPLLGGRGIRKTILTPMLSDYGQKPRLTWTALSKYTPLHIPQSYTIKINPYLFYHDFCGGFNKGKALALREKDKRLGQLKQQPVRNRILFRPTKAYFALIKDMQVRMSLIPDTNIEDFLFKKLQTLPMFTKVTNLNTLIASEINQLKRGQIPIFYSDIFSTKILDIHHKTVTHLIGTCGEELEKHLEKLEQFYKEVDIQIKEAYMRNKKT